MTAARKRPAETETCTRDSYEEIQCEVERRLEPWGRQLGSDRHAYLHHVMRVLALCDQLYRRTSGLQPSLQPQYLNAAAFHDLGIWTAGTLDYLAPSTELACRWLQGERQEHLQPVVAEMIEQHHKIRRAGGAASPTEIFRRADTIDLTCGLRRFGVGRREYRAIVRKYPYAGFHRRLLTLGWHQVLTNPSSPLPMVRW